MRYLDEKFEINFETENLKNLFVSNKIDSITESELIFRIKNISAHQYFYILINVLPTICNNNRALEFLFSIEKDEFDQIERIFFLKDYLDFNVNDLINYQKSSFQGRVNFALKANYKYQNQKIYQLIEENTYKQLREVLTISSSLTDIVIEGEYFCDFREKEVKLNDNFFNVVLDYEFNFNNYKDLYSREELIESMFTKYISEQLKTSYFLNKTGLEFDYLLPLTHGVYFWKTYINQQLEDIKEFDQFERKKQYFYILICEYEKNTGLTEVKRINIEAEFLFVPSHKNVFFITEDFQSVPDLFVENKLVSEYDKIYKTLNLKKWISESCTYQKNTPSKDLEFEVDRIKTSLDNKALLKVFNQFFKDNQLTYYETHQKKIMNLIELSFGKVKGNLVNKKIDISFIPKDFRKDFVRVFLFLLEKKKIFTRKTALIVILSKIIKTKDFTRRTLIKINSKETLNGKRINCPVKFDNYNLRQPIGTIIDKL